MDLQAYKQKLKTVAEKIKCGEYDTIPEDARPKVPDVDYDQESYVIISYSRKDFEEVYLFLEYLYREGYRFWYDNGMQGDDKWVSEFQAKYENPNCLGSVIFFSDRYISSSTKAELSILYENDRSRKQNVMISLIPLSDLWPDRLLGIAMKDGRLILQEVNEVAPIVSNIISQEKEKTIHRYMRPEDIPSLAEKLSKVFQIRSDIPEDAKDFLRVGDTLFKYVGCKRDVTLPGSTSVIGESAFKANETLESVTIPNGVTTICDEAFSGCEALKAIDFGETVKQIKFAAFEGCSALTDVVIPDSVGFLGSGAFKDCYALKTVKLSNCITEIEDFAFHSCVKLSNVSFPEGVTRIGSSAFFGCALETLIIPESVTEIGEDAFCHTALTNVILPPRVSKIGNFAFYGCKGLESITIPTSVTEIGEGAFSGCPALTHIIYRGTKAQWTQIARGSIGVARVECTDGIFEQA